MPDNPFANPEVPPDIEDAQEYLSDLFEKTLAAAVKVCDSPIQRAALHVLAANHYSEIGLYEKVVEELTDKLEKADIAATLLRNLRASVDKFIQGRKPAPEPAEQGTEGSAASADAWQDENVPANVAQESGNGKPVMPADGEINPAEESGDEPEETMDEDFLNRYPYIKQTAQRHPSSPRVYTGPGFGTTD